jgi:cytochrome b subunit of formate dehydrogenase
MHRRALPNSRPPGDGPHVPFGAGPPRGRYSLGQSPHSLMLLFRLVFGLLLVSGLVCFALYIGTGQAVWRQRGIVIVKWTVIAGLGFFAVLILERLALAL